MKKIVWLLMMVVMPMVANAAFSRNADLEDEDELLHRLDQYIPQFGIRIVHKKVGSLTNILYLYR